jgi:hypothetical protein
MDPIRFGLLVFSVEPFGRTIHQGTIVYHPLVRCQVFFCFKKSLDMLARACYDCVECVPELSS